MAFAKLLPIIVAEDLDATRDHYVDALGWTLVDKMDGYLQVRVTADEDAPELAFMAPQPGGGPMGGFGPFTDGLAVSVPVADADAHHAQLAARGIDATPPTDKPWGWRSFIVRDPNGVALDFYHEITQDRAQDASS